MHLPPLFNPSNDMALAANVRQYFPPRRIQQMEADLAPLSRLWDEGPWGWSLATRQHYLRLGLPASLLPSDDQLAALRRLSSREFGVAYYREMSEACGYDEAGGIAVSAGQHRKYAMVPCRARFCRSLAEVQSSLSNFQFSIFNLQFSILKAPWSSSGRGNLVVDGSAVDARTRQRIEGIIREQGGIVVESFYSDKALDFALEFQVTDGGTQFVGYSVFSADEMGHYGGNLIAPQDELERLIDLPQSLLDSLADYHRRALSRLPYRGPVGIDMMRLRNGHVHPCVELNFRRTMGLLAIHLYNKGLTADQVLAGDPDHGFAARIASGRLSITYHP